jgi:hypothetical protein
VEPRSVGAWPVEKWALLAMTSSSSMARHELAEDGLGSAARVDVGGVEEVDALVATALIHRARGRFVGFAPERHRSEAQARHLNTRVAEGAIVHGPF